MSSWFYIDSKLTVNTAKTEVLFFGRPNKVKSCKDITPITFQGSQIESTDKVKYLGVIFDEGMTWEDQANKARKNAYFNLNKINKIKNLIDDRIKYGETLRKGVQRNLIACCEVLIKFLISMISCSCNSNHL